MVKWILPGADERKKGKLIKQTWNWWQSNSNSLVAIGTLALACATIWYIIEARNMRIETKRLVDLSVKDFQLRAYPSFLIILEDVYFDAGKLYQTIKIHNKGELTAHDVLFLVVHVYENAQTETRVFKNLVQAYYEGDEWKTSLNYKTKIFREGHKSVASKTGFPEGQSIDTLKYLLLYIKFRVPYDANPKFETFSYTLKKDFRKTDNEKQYYFWQEIDANLSADLIKRHMDTIMKSQLEGVELVKEFMIGYNS